MSSQFVKDAYKRLTPFSKRVITLRYSDDDISRAECAEIVRGPGKFEREPIYLPYVWNRLLNWGDPPDDNESNLAYTEYCDSVGIIPEDNSDHLEGEDWSEFFATFDRYAYFPTMEDRLMFPELEHVESVVCWESDQGFVYSFERELAPSIDTIFVGI